jgi:RepB DNA-primase from phage plasmid
MDLLDRESDDSRRAFFSLAFGASRGYIALAFLSPDKSKFFEEFYTYPDELPELLRSVRNRLPSHNVYFCPQLFQSKRRKKEEVLSTPTAWADLDECPPEKMLVRPSLVIESSANRWQALWSLDEVESDDAERISKRIAYHHSTDGADRSGWDLTQLLRVPLTYNFKYNMVAGVQQTVRLHDVFQSRYRLQDFTSYPAGADAEVDIMPMPDLSAMPIAPENLLQEKRRMMNPRLWQLFNTEPEEDWSKPLWELHMMLFEAGFNRDESFLIAREAKCNKYARDKRSDRLLWKETCRAHARGETTAELLEVPQGPERTTLLTPEEQERVRLQPDSFVERYITWARGLGDAAHQYHQAGAFIILSTLLSGNVRLPTSFGTFIPNLWFMILADTTLTRKTTAMDIAMDLIEALDSDSILATDGSIEGLMTSLSLRPGRPSIFLRDEFSGLLEAMTKKDYYAGMAEVFTKLYDGKMQKRVLRKEVLEVRDPRLILFAGGIKNKVTGLLTFEQVSSGFMPRFIFITAESDVTKLKPLGPPTDRTGNDKQLILDEMQDLQAHYQRMTTLELKNAPGKIESALIFDAEMTEEAWIRYNELEFRMLEVGTASEFRADVLTPTYDRLSKSILKAAVLLAASRSRAEQIVVELDDILRAIHYGEQWKIHADDIMANIGKTTYERQIVNIHKFVWRKPGCSRSQIMQHYHLNAKVTTEVFQTMEQRNLIVIRRTGKTEQLFPTQVAPPEEFNGNQPA